MKAKLFVASVVVIAGFVLTWMLSESTVPQPTNIENTNTVSLSVSAINVVPSTMSNAIKAVGISKTRWELNIISPVAGKIKTLPSEIEPGMKVTQNTLLASIVDTSFQSDLIVAKARVAQAELNLARYKHEQYVVKQVNV